eukprot:2180869-Pyramimonas_sp.AAC.1
MAPGKHSLSASGALRAPFGCFGVLFGFPRVLSGFLREPCGGPTSLRRPKKQRGCMLVSQRVRFAVFGCAAGAFGHIHVAW